MITVRKYDIGQKYALNNPLLFDMFPVDMLAL